MADPIDNNAPPIDELAPAQDQPAATTAAPETPAPAAPKPDGFDGLLSEFNTATEKPTAPAAAQGPNFNAPLTQEHAIIDYLMSIENERVVVREKADFDAIAARATEAVAEYDLPKDYARLRMEKWGANEYATNAEFARAWDNRHSNPEAAKAVGTAINKAVERLKHEASKQPRQIDKDATADRLAVTEYVRRSSGKVPEDQPKNYGQMSDADFRKEMLSLGLSPNF